MVGESQLEEKSSLQIKFQDKQAQERHHKESYNILSDEPYGIQLKSLLHGHL